MDHRIEEVMADRGFTQTRLAAKLETLPTQINRLIRGERRLTLDWLQKIAAALECRASDLLVDGDFRNRLAADEGALLEAYRSLRLEDRIRMVRIADVMAGRDHDDSLFRRE